MKRDADTILRRETQTTKAEKLMEWLENADAVVIGAGAVLSSAAGFTYTGKRFQKNFRDFEEKYGFQDMYAGGFYPYATLEEFWAYWSRYIYINRYDQPAGKTYEDLLSLVNGKNYFVLTINVDHRFQVAGFDRQRLFYTQGDYGLFQCSLPCHAKTYDNESEVRQMLAEQRDMRIPAELVPRCPVCGRPMSMNLRADDTFVEDEGWHGAFRRYRAFLDGNQGKNVLFWELGIGMNTPGIIKYPFRQMTFRNKNAHYACVNLEAAYAPEEIAARSVCFTQDIGGVLQALKARKGL